MYKDRLTNLNWSVNLGSLNWSQAIDACAHFTAFGGGWRLPTQKEWLEAYADGFRYLMGTANFHSNGNSVFWTSTTRAAGNYADQAWAMGPLNGLSREQPKTNGYATVCVKE